MHKYLKTLLTIGALTGAAAAQAHTGTATEHSLMSGLSHPLLGWDHLLVAVAIGMWAAVHKGKQVAMLPLAFVIALMGGMAVATSGFVLPLSEPMILLSMAMIGGLMALQAKASSHLLVTLLAGFALFHGYAHVSEMPTSASFMGYSVGLVMATLALHLSGIWLGRQMSPLYTRICGAMLGAVGLLSLVA